MSIQMSANVDVECGQGSLQKSMEMSKWYDQKFQCQAPEDDAQDKRIQKNTKNVDVDWKDLQMSNICRCRWFLKISTRYGRHLYTPLTHPVPARLAK